LIRLTTIAAAGLIAGCASLPPDGGIGRVSELTRERTGQAVAAPRTAQEAQAIERRVDAILAQPLSANSAVELALLNNRALRASLAGLGIAQADWIEATRLHNPSLGFSRLSGGGVLEIERSIVFNLLDLLLLPATRRAQQQRFEQAQVQAADEAVAVATQARRAFFNAVAAQELVRCAERVKDAADASNELTLRMTQAGNLSKLDHMQQRLFYANAVADLARARHRAVATRERLTRWLGLAAEPAGLPLPERLPELPAQALALGDAEQTALERRLDVQMARRQLEATAQALGLTQATQWVNALELGLRNKNETGSPRTNGYQVALELPLFDFGAARRTRAEATYQQALHRTADIAVRARSEVRESYSAYRTAHDLARSCRDEVVPLRQRISEEKLLRYNGMLIGVLELLDDTREQARSVAECVQALHEFWLADTDLQTAWTSHSPERAGSSAATEP
jgi:outer membrane protein TolC